MQDEVRTNYYVLLKISDGHGHPNIVAVSRLRDTSQPSKNVEQKGQE